MGMLIRRHREAIAEAEGKAPKRKRTRKTAAVKPAQEPQAPDPVEPSWSDLTDDELLEAYAISVPDGEAGDRDAIVAELEALNAEADPDEAPASE